MEIWDSKIGIGIKWTLLCDEKETLIGFDLLLYLKAM